MTIITAENLGKKYIIGHQRQGRYLALRDVLAHTARGIWQRIRHPLSPNRETTDLEEIWALKDVNFEIKQGERVGIIGRNGAGKSTLLKILSRITHPTTGRVHIKGRVASLLEVGTGFHPELTGRENIYLNGAVLGMTRQEIKTKFDEIVAFAEVEKFLDTPVKRYSSGMYVRLAFAVAAHLEPEILLVDEVLAVGDAGFQKKCLGKMNDISTKEGRTVLFVSHNMSAVSQLCRRGMLFEKGKLHCDHDVEKAIEKYQLSAISATTNTISIFPHRTGSGKIRFKNVVVSSENSELRIYSGGFLDIKMTFETSETYFVSNLKIGIGVNGSFGERLITLLNKYDPIARESRAILEDNTSVVCRVPCLLLRPGIYYLSFYIDINGDVADRIKDALSFEVHENDFYGTGVLPSSTQGPFLINQTWNYLET